MTVWLSESQQKDWRAFVSMVNLLPYQFGRILQDDFGIGLSDYEILVRLSESADRSMRMSELAASTLSSRSRLSHQIDRLEKAGLVARKACMTDRRGSIAEMTETGWQLLVKAAPIHVQSVRDHLVDVLTEDELKTLGEISNKVLEKLTPELQDKIITAPSSDLQS
jgi:DNA-binding MarR family transcriptional regulator